jgi:hypothetical protein
MSIPSNLYAEKVFAEHPTVLWALDDKADYVSLVTEQQRSVFDWTITGGTAVQSLETLDEPFNDSSVSKIIGDLTSEDFGEITCISQDILNFSDLNSYMSTFSIGAYLYSISSYISSIEIGYEYYDSTTGTKIQKLKNYNTSIYQNWFFVAETFEIPLEDTTFNIVLKIRYLGGALSTDDYHFLINGITVGQWSEEFNSSSLGVTKQTLPSTISLETSNVIEAKSYGLAETPGYYFIKDNALLAKNSGIPLVYGSKGTTIISPNFEQPSLIIPGHGFLNEDGKFKEYTLEMWMRINSDSKDKKRICGPIKSDDGIYVDGPFITLKINNNYSSHYIGEWTRPMLVHIRITNNSANLLINGEQVISLNYITENLQFPNKYDIDEKDQDWIGFYGYADVSPIEIDCVAIYSYQVPSLVAKRRFVYGQGVELPENINASYSGTSMFIDYSFADYTKNYSYPDLVKWSEASIDNLETSTNSLFAPNYSLPELFFTNKTQEQFYEDCKLLPNEENLYIRMKPNSNWNNTDGYLLFDKLNITNNPVKCFYGVFKILSTPISNQVLFKVEDKSTNNSFSIELKPDLVIDYKLKFSNEDEIIYKSVNAIIGEEFTVGINIDQFVDYYGGDIRSFFGNRGSLNLYAGGNKELNKTFSGNIYKIGFATERNFLSIKELFNEFGVPVDFENVFDTFGPYIDYDAGEYYGASQYFWDYILQGGFPLSYSSLKLIEHVASYTLSPKKYFNNFTLDIDLNGYWEDKVALRHFAQYVTNAKGDSYYDLDFIQFNLNYPAPSKYIEKQKVGSWKYKDLKSEYETPIQRTYESLDNHLYTGYVNYEDLKNKSSKSYSYDTSSSLVKSYITFEYLSSSSTNIDSYFTVTVNANKNGIIEPGTYVVGYNDDGTPIYDSFMNTKYEVVDGMLIYPPKGIDFNDIYIVIRLDFKVLGTLKNPVKIKTLQLASQAYNETSANPIGTRFGVPVYPYKKSGIYYDYKGLNPYTIYKGTSPYLYLTKNSGIQVKGTYDPLVNRGLAIPINSSKSADYKVMAMQAAVRYDQDFFPYSPTEIFEVESKGSLLKFFMVANHPDGKRAKIYAVNANTGQIEDGIGFYWNGNIVKEPNITIREWGMLGISFSSLLDFSNYVGSIKINGPILVNLVSHYKSTNLQEVQNITERPWFKVKYNGPLTLDWEYWNPTYNWGGVLVLATTSYYGVNPSDIYNSYVGTNKFIVDDTRPFRLNSYQYFFDMEVYWQSSTENAV